MITMRLGQIFLLTSLLSAQTIISVDKAMPPPDWALAERALLRANAEAAREFYRKYVDDRGFFRCIERWGGNDGPDDTMETIHNWPLLYALGGSESVMQMFQKAWEGHLVQFTQAKAPGIEVAKNGMFYKEFITAFDWEHTGEGLAGFFFYGLGRPEDPVYVQRARRYAGLYMNEDPEAPNYDPKHKIIRSLHNGSRGPKLTPAKETDWGGEPVPGRPDRLTRYSTAANIRGDHPLNLVACTLGFQAHALTGEDKYRKWLLEYAGAWRDRVESTGGNIPTNIGLDGRIGGEWSGKWYDGVFGWNFWPQESSRNYYMRGARIAFGEAFLLTADPGFISPLRKQIQNLYAAAKVENGRTLLPNKHGDKGWYGYTPNLHADVQRDLYLWSMQPADIERIASDPWISFLHEKNPSYPFQAFQQDLDRIRRQVERIRRDPSTPDTRASDQAINPVATTALVNLTLGANDPGASGNIVHARVRYFDPERRRAGLPEDVAALVEKVLPEETVVTLVNVSPVETRELIVQMGAYAEHQCESVTVGSRTVPVSARHFQVRIAPGSGETLRIRIRRYAHPPTLAFPWHRSG